MDLATNSFLLAQRIAPKDSLNLVLRGMRLQKLAGIDFAIKYSGALVPYLDHLEFGTKIFDGHKYFIRNKTYDAIQALVDATYNGRFNQEAFNTTLQATKDLKPNVRTNERYLQAIGGVSLVTR